MTERRNGMEGKGREGKGREGKGMNKYIGKEQSKEETRENNKEHFHFMLCCNYHLRFACPER
jgi:hypothetical protein